MIGTPSYVAPELYDKNMDFRVDIWAIGCIIYELCYLKLAFDGKYS